MRLPAQPVSPHPVNIVGHTTPRGLYAHGQKDSSVQLSQRDSPLLAGMPESAEWVIVLLPSEGHVVIVSVFAVGKG